MCGLVGIVSSYALGKEGSNFVRESLIADQLRGVDATGLALVDKDNKVSVFKKALSAADFVETNMGGRALDAVKNSFVVIGHNRATTMGSTVDETSHPFEFGRFVGAHNGTIHSHKTLLPVKEHPIDSMNLIASFNHEGNLQDVLRELYSGAYAVTVYDKEEEKLLFARNDARPLHIVQNKDNIMWASEAAMLYWIASRNKMLDKDSKFLSVPTEQIMSYDCNEMRFDKPIKFLTKSYPSWNSSSNFSRGSSYSEIKSKVKQGEVHGTKYDFNMSKSEIEATLGLFVDEVKIYPARYIPHSAKSDMGRLHGYVLDEIDGTLFPATVYNISKKLYDEAMSTGKFLVAEITNGMFTKSGNVVHLVGINATIDQDDNELSIYDKEFYMLLDQDTVWKTGTCFSMMNGHAVDDIKDVSVRKAYLIKKQNKRVTVDTLNQTKLSPGTVIKGEASVKKVTANQSTQQKNTGSTSKQLAVQSTNDKENKDTSFRNSEKVPGPNGAITPARFSILTKSGCCICSSDIYVEDADYIKWLVGAGAAPVCKSCWEDEDMLTKVGCDPSVLMISYDEVNAV